MNYKLKPILPIIFSIFLLGCSGSGQVLKIVTDDSTHQFKVEVASTEEEKRQGLMEREFLADDSGMLFVYDEEKKQSFWMKNMIIPLDILFIGSNLVINHIAHNAIPCEPSDDCINYVSPNKSKYVLELNAGVSEKLNIEKGDSVLIPK